MCLLVFPGTLSLSLSLSLCVCVCVCVCVISRTRDLPGALKDTEFQSNVFDKCALKPAVGSCVNVLGHVHEMGMAKATATETGAGEELRDVLNGPSNADICILNSLPANGLYRQLSISDLCDRGQCRARDIEGLFGLDRRACACRYFLVLSLSLSLTLSLSLSVCVCACVCVCV